MMMVPFVELYIGSADAASIIMNRDEPRRLTDVPGCVVTQLLFSTSIVNTAKMCTSLYVVVHSSSFRHSTQR
jgi:hypothetical protein